MKLNRREFVRQSGALGAGLALSPSIVSGLISPACSTSKGALDVFGLQLYSLRDVLPGNVKPTLEQVSSYGYTQIESYAGADGIFWGMTNKEFSSFLKGLGMDLVSSHCDINNDFEKLAAEAGEIGMKYLICPFVGAQPSMDDFKRIADDFNAKGEICKKNGLRFAYHNHDYSFKKLEDQFPQAVMMDNTDPGLVDFQLDLYWIVTAGEDPAVWFEKYRNRFKLCHVKDRQKNAAEREATCTLGTGTIDYASILKAARQAGTEYYIVEQEHYGNSTPLECMKADAQYLAALDF